MKLYLAIAVLMLAFAALTDAQDATLDQRFQDFSVQVTEGFNTFAAKAKETFGDIQSSDIAVKTQSFFDDLLTKIKEKIAEANP